MPYLSLEFLVFLFLLVVIAAALDLWAIRAWKRRRGKAVQRPVEKPAGHPKADRRVAQKAPSAPSSRSTVVALRASGPDSDRNPAGKTPHTEVVPLKKETAKSAGLRGRKKLPQQASLSVPGKSGRLSHVDISMDIPEGESIRLTLESVGGGKIRPASAKAGSENVLEAREVRATRPAWFPTGWGLPAGGVLAEAAEHIRSNGRWLFTIALILYLATRLIGLTKWPIYFFTDEAVQTNFAAELVNRGYVWDEAESIPVFFENAGQYEMNLSVYVQLIPYLMFGKSVFVTRAVSVLITLLGMAALGWILRRAFHLPLWWTGVLLLSIVPVWFLHSRTAFEPGESIAFYALFLYFYMRYREDTPWMLLPALLCGALSAYTYSPSRDVGNGFGTVKPGGVTDLSFGMGLALNERASFSFGFQLSVVGESSQSGDFEPFKTLGQTGTQTLGTARFGLTYAFTRQTALNLTLGIGVTDETPSLELTARVPISF